MIGLYRLIRQSSLCISFVVMAWVPLMFAALDTLPLMRREIQREALLVSTALQMATPRHKAGLLATVVLLMPVFLAALLIDTWPAFAAHVRLQARLWVFAHRKVWHG